VDISQVGIFVDGLDHPEGLAFASDGYLWAGGEIGQVYRISPDGADVRVIANTGGFSLGMAFDRQGNLYICNHKLPAVVKVTPDGGVSIFADEVGGRKIRVPNFPVFDPDGNLYVSDSGDAYANNGAVYRFTRDGRGEVFAAPFDFANGLAIDPSGSVLYVVESFENRVSRVRIRSDGTAGERDVYVSGIDRIPDGLALDSQGTLYITCYASNTICSADPSGRLSTLVHDPIFTTLHNPTNAAFGGPNYDDLYIANLGRSFITKVPLGIKGQRLYGGLCD
jgi:gluconolactonase